MKRNSLIAIILIVIIIVVSVGVAAYIIFFPPIPPVLPDNPNEVAIVFATGGLGDKSFNDGCYAGAVNAHNDFNVNFTRVEPNAIAEYEPFLRAYAEHAGLANPYELIISIGFDQADALMAVAGDFPDQEFAIVDMYINETTYPNVRSIIFSANEGSALVGALAGLYTATGNIGFVGGMDIPLIREFAAGYFWGANITVPGIAMNATQTANVDNAWVGDWANPGLAETIADGLYTTGFDIIFAAAGRSGLGVIDSAYKQNATIGPVWAIGVDSPQMYLGTDESQAGNPEDASAPTVVLTSMLKRVDVAINQTIVQKVISDQSIGGFTLWNLSNGGVGWELNNTLLGTNWAVSPADQAIIAGVAQGIVNGTYSVPIDFTWL